MALSLKIGKCSLLGNYRENNEDAVEVKQFPEKTICIVADGMGGQAAGETASRMATEVVPRELRDRISASKSVDEIKGAIRKAIVQANDEIMDEGQRDRDLRNMGTTIVLGVWLRDNQLFVAGVGDSRAYLVRGGVIDQLTTDHSLAQALVEARTISPEEAREHRFRNVLWKYLGTKEVGEGPEVKPVPIQPGDRFLLCTDGLSGAVPDEQLRAAMEEQVEPQECAEALCQLALDSGSRDNVSCVVIHVSDE
jgi:serine/threonine protein phosphatase PrpC